MDKTDKDVRIWNSGGRCILPQGISRIYLYITEICHFQPALWIAADAGHQGIRLPNLYAALSSGEFNFLHKKSRSSLESQLFYNCLTRLYVIYTFYNIYLFFTHQVNFTALFNIKLTNWRKRYIFKFIISRVVWTSRNFYKQGAATICQIKEHIWFTPTIFFTSKKYIVRIFS